MDIQEIGFGDFCTIEQKRYVGPNEFYGYKVVGRKKSNAWTDVPVDARNSKETLHDHSDDVVTVICNNLDDRTVHQFRVSDLASVRKAQAVPEWAVIVPKLSANYLFNTVPDLGFKQQDLKDTVLYHLNYMALEFRDSAKQFVEDDHAKQKAVIEAQEQK